MSDTTAQAIRDRIAQLERDLVADFEQLARTVERDAEELKRIRAELADLRASVKQRANWPTPTGPTYRPTRALSPSVEPERQENEP